jgi:two-component system response regulator RpaA
MSGRPRKNLTTGEVALLCEVAPGTVGRWVDSGALAGFRLPGSLDRWVPVAVFREFLARHRMPADGLEEYLSKVERRRGEGEAGR